MRTKKPRVGIVPCKECHPVRALGLRGLSTGMWVKFHMLVGARTFHETNMAIEYAHCDKINYGSHVL